MKKNVTDVTGTSTKQTTYEMVIHKRFFTETLRSVGYTPDTAKFELIANSLDAGATQIDLVYNEDESTFIIVDNGKGMSFETLRSSMGFAVNREYGTNDTGYFGMGMKSSVINLLDLHKNMNDEDYYVTIETFDGEEATKIKYSPIVDPNHFYRDEECEKSEIGTRISVKNTQHFLIGALKNNIATYFYKPLADGKSKIFVHKIKNGEITTDEVTPNDPLYRDNRELSRNFTYASVVGSNDQEYEIKIEAVVLEEGKIERHSWDKNNKDKSGFAMKKSGVYIRYGDQYVETGGTFGILAHHPSQNAIRIEFSVPKELTDVFPIKFNKTNGIDALDRTIYPQLSDLIIKIKEMYSWGLRVRSEKGLVKPDQDVIDETDKIINQINRSAENAGFKRPKEDRGPRGPYDKTLITPDEDKEPKKATVKTKKTYDVEFKDFSDSGKFWFLTTDKGRFTITFNISHPFYTNIYTEMDTKGKKYLLEFLASIAQAQYLTQINEIDNTSDIEYFWDDFWGEMSRKLNHLISKR